MLPKTFSVHGFTPGAPDITPMVTPHLTIRQPLRFQSWSHDELVSAFLDSCLPSSASQHVPLAWLRSLLPMHKDVDALPLAISAVAFGWAGRVLNHGGGGGDLVAKSLQLYNAAVHQLRTTTTAPEGRQMTMKTTTAGGVVWLPLQQVLATTAVLVLYELYEFGSESSPGWLCHVAGMAVTLRELGPEMVAFNPYRDIFSFCRMLFVSNCSPSISRWQSEG